jgi:hypothetical protein
MLIIREKIIKFLYKKMGTKKTLVGDLILFLLQYFPKDPNRRVLSKSSKRQERGFFDFQKFQRTRTKGSLISKIFQKIGTTGEVLLG